MRRFRRAVRALLPLLLWSACDAAEPAPAPGGRPDPAGAVAVSPRRVVSLSPRATRFVVALGAGDRLIAVDAGSARGPAPAGLPVVDLPGALALRPDLLLVGDDLGEEPPGSAALRAAGGRVVVYAPHEFGDVSDLVRDVGAELVGFENAVRFEAAFSRPLARIGGSSRGRPRPRVVAVVSLDPLAIAGGHSFETDLIEIAGGRSATHEGAESRLAIGVERLVELAPDLVLVMAERPASELQERAVRNALPTQAELAFLPVAPDFWLDDDPAEPARRLRVLIEPLAARMAP